MKSKIILLTFCILSFTFSHAQVVINECTAANLDDAPDNHGNYEDWLELYNMGASSVDLTGYYLSDDPATPTKWAFPAGITINANSYLRIWCSGRDAVEAGGAHIHTNFKMTQSSPGSEAFVFSDPTGTILDQRNIDIPNQEDQSWGRYPDGAAEWKIFSNPTPGASNTGTSYSSYAAKPNMEPNSGNYVGSVTVTITDTDPDVTIHYTTDGKLPTASSPTYTAPITISSTTVLRSIGISSDASETKSFVSTNTYFIDESSTIPVISIAGDQVDDLINGDGWIQPLGSFELFDKDFNLINEAEGQYNEHGNDSWAYPQRGLDYITRDQLGYGHDINQNFFSQVTDRTKYQRLILKAAANDNYPFQDGGAEIRDAYTQHLSQLGGLDLDERSIFFAILFVNGDYWGLYDVREKVDDADYTKYYYGQDEYNIDFLQCWGGTWAAYGTMSAWNPFVNFVTSNDMTVPANYAYVTDNLDVLSLIDYVLLNTQVVCKDWLNWNTAWWRGYNPDGTGTKWRYALWDQDATYGHYYNYTGIPDITATANPCDPLGLGGVDPNGHIDMLNALLDNPDFFSLYINRYADLINTTFSCENMQTVLDSMIAVIDPEMNRHIDKWGGSYTEWQDNVTTMKNFIDERCAYIVSGIEDCFSTPAYNLSIQVDPPAAGNLIQVNTIIPPVYPYNAVYFGGTTFTMKALPAAGYIFDHWEFLNHTPSPSTTSDSVSLSLVSTDTIVAYFTTSELPSYNFTADVVPAASGNVTVNTYTPAAYPYATAFLIGTMVNMNATPAPGYVFDYWELENHVVNPDPFTTDVNFSLSTFENVKAHFKLSNAVNNINTGVQFTVVPTITNNTITIQYDLLQPASLSIGLYSATGVKVADISSLNENGTGSHKLTINLSDYNISSGIYFVKLNAGSNSSVEKIIYSTK